MCFPKLSLLLLLSFILFFSSFRVPVSAIKKSYIVYLGSHSHGPNIFEADLQRVANFHYDLLASFVGSTEKATDSIIYSYKRHINGFAAMLDEEEASEMAKYPGVISVFLNEPKKLHTTHSWDFMSLENNGLVHESSLWTKAKFGEDIIIANLDTGVWPESRSFSDEGMGPVPKKWKGTCQNNTKDGIGVPCNRKLIGASFFSRGYLAAVGSMNSSMYSARDHDGHGTHTLSTAGGSFVPGANVFGFGNGTAKGGSPRARVVAYKVCWPAVGDGGCYDADIVRAFEMAVDDGVDVISMSLGGKSKDYLTDGSAIGAFFAVKHGLVVVASAGNSGPTAGTVSNVAPWIITVGASTLDRDFFAIVELQNGLRLEGVSLSKPLPEDKLYPLISASQAAAASISVYDALLCKPDTLDPKKVKGKIIACLRGDTSRIDKGKQALLAGAAGMILCNDELHGNEVTVDAHVLPTAHIKYKDGVSVFAYINSTTEPMGYITAPKEQLKTTPAPSMAAFSSRGPNTVTPEILKPDVTAPGANIVAAYTETNSPTDPDFDNRRTAFNMLSGTSMSCPHVSGVVGLLRALHPEWSAAAIKSALMTTARTRDNTVNHMLDGFDNEKATPFAYGAGHIRPNEAMDPGLVYDLTNNDYLEFLCGSGYNSTVVEQLAEAPYKCPESFSLLDFNYPSITVPNLSGKVTATRKLKNVGTPSVYTVQVREPYGVSVTVEPKALKFDSIGEEKSFKLTFEAKWKGAATDYKFGQLVWSDGVHHVKSPIVVAGGGGRHSDPALLSIG